MVRIHIDTTGLKRKAAELRLTQTALAEAFAIALRTAAQAKIDRIAAATPRSIIVRDGAGGPHVHMADRWSLRDTPDGVSIENPASYAGFVAMEPVDAYGSRVEEYHNRELRAELDTVEAEIRAGMLTELDALLPAL